MTLANGCLGAIAVFVIFTNGSISGNDIHLISTLIGAALLLDVLDGWFARLLNVDGPLGVQLDSLADVISFGLVPTALAFITMLQFSWGWPTLIPLGILAGSIYRLANFNVKGSESKGFLGVPTPLNTMFWLGLTAYASTPDNLLMALPDTYGVMVTTLLVALSAWAMNSRIPIFSFKDMKPQWQDNWLRLLWVACTVYFLFTWGLSGLTLAVPLLLLFSTIEKRFT